MQILNLFFHLAVVALVSTGELCNSHEAEMQNVWEQIKTEAAQLPDSSNDKELYLEKFTSASKRIAEQYDRDAIQNILIGQLKEGSRLGAAIDLSDHVIAELVDSDGEHGIKHSLGGFSSLNTPGMTGLAALVSTRDEAALDLLFEIVFCAGDFTFLKKEGREPAPVGGSLRVQYTHFDQFQFVATQMLRGFELSEARFKKLKTLMLKEQQDLLTNPDSEWVKRNSVQVLSRQLRSGETRAGHLLVVVSSIEFANGIPSNEERERYRDFQSRIWLGYSLCPKGSRNAKTAPQESAKHVEKGWNKGDHFFVEALFKDYWSNTGIELSIACYLVHLDPRKELGYLKTIARSRSPNCYAAQMGLKSQGYRTIIMSEDEILQLKNKR